MGARHGAEETQGAGNAETTRPALLRPRIRLGLRPEARGPGPHAVTTPGFLDAGRLPLPDKDSLPDLLWLGSSQLFSQRGPDFQTSVVVSTLSNFSKNPAK